MLANSGLVTQNLFFPLIIIIADFQTFEYTGKAQENPTELSQRTYGRASGTPIYLYVQVTYSVSYPIHS